MVAKYLTHLPNLADLMLDAVFMVDADGRVMYVSAACERIFGYRPDEMTGRQLFDFLYPEDRERTAEEATKVMAGLPRIGFENRYVRKDGSLATVMWSACWSEADRVRVGVARDISGRKRAEALQAAIYAISEAAHDAADIESLCNGIHQIIAQLISVADFLIATLDEQTGKFGFRFHFPANSSLVHEPGLQQVCEDVIAHRRAKLKSGSGSASGKERASRLVVPLVVQKNAIGALVVKSHPGTLYRRQDKELLMFVSEQIAAAIERKRLHGRLLRMAQYDELTGLPNRRLFHDRAEMAFARARREQRRAAVLYLDIDGFKRVNDVFGHAAGDLLLQEVGRRLQQCVRASDTVARLGGDEFVVLLEQTDSFDDAAAIAEKIRAAIASEVQLDGRALYVTSSIGMALYPDHADSVEKLLRHADDAMYSAKKDTPPAQGG
jgi:diguanylate cyclase (GGDEF)-like protein/PAS domain S-box-containing protein